MAASTSSRLADLERHSVRTGAFLQHLQMRNDGVCVHQCRDPAHSGHSFDQDILAFAVEARRHQADAGCVSAGTGKRSDQPRRDHIFDHAEQRNRLRHDLQRTQRRFRSSDNRVGCGFYQGCRDLRNLVVLKTEPSGGNFQVPAFDEAIEAQFVKEGPVRWTADRSEKANPISATHLLRSHRKRPRRRTTGKTEKFPPLHIRPRGSGGRIVSAQTSALKGAQPGFATAT